MFTKPIDEITFDDVESFCKEWPESVRVEYKQQLNIKKQIPKIVSSFANYYGGFFFIGVETDKTKNEVIFPIQGIPQRNGIEEQIQQSALTGIYPGVIPEIKLVDVPNSQNVVVVVRVDESVQAPHAIEGSTKVYIRTGSITQPYKLSDMDRIKYMFKRREDAQVAAQQILNRIKERAQHLNCGQGVPSITVIANPVFPYRPVISPSDIIDALPSTLNYSQRVAGGVCTFLSSGRKYTEFNEYGIAYCREVLNCSSNKEFEYLDLRDRIEELIRQASTLYRTCDYLGNIEVSVQLREVFGTILMDNQCSFRYGEEAGCLETEFCVSEQCLPHDLYDPEKRKKVSEDLICQLIWRFNVPSNEPQIREKVRKSLASI